jgi:GNAT superfamily N-acetyltransferase
MISLPTGIALTDDQSRIDIDLAFRWLQETYWGAMTTRETFDRAIANCCVVAAFVDGEQRGFARVVTDYATFAWVCDVVVAAEFRGQGIGRAMVSYMLAHPRLQGLRRWNLNTRDAQDVYTPLGFKAVTEPGAYMERLDASYANSIAPKL